MVTIAITHLDGNEYEVTLAERGRSTAHTVTVWPSDVEQYAPGALPEALIEASFRFLLEREPKEAILPRFELPVIERYFPEYRATIRRMVD